MVKPPNFHFHKLLLTVLGPSAKSIYCLTYELRSRITGKNEMKYLTGLLDSQLIDVRYAKTVSKIKDV